MQSRGTKVCHSEENEREHEFRLYWTDIIGDLHHQAASESQFRLHAIEDEILSEDHQFKQGVLELECISEKCAIVAHRNGVAAFIDNTSQGRAVLQSPCSVTIHDIVYAEPLDGKSA